jgi:dienelactone hydrolase
VHSQYTTFVSFAKTVFMPSLTGLPVARGRTEAAEQLARHQTCVAERHGLVHPRSHRPFRLQVHPWVRALCWYVYRNLSCTVPDLYINKGNSFPGGPGSWAAAVIRSMLSWYGSTVSVPVYEHAPLLSPPSTFWPLVVFSHGLGGTRTTYSTVCADLASHGRIVIALEHRDGTGPAVFPVGRTIPYIVPDEVVWPDEKAEEEWARGAYNSEKALRFRKAQLDFRRREVYEALHAVRLLSAGKIAESGLEALDVDDFDFSRWFGHIDTDQVDLVGHSFGGATMVSRLRSLLSLFAYSLRSYLYSQSRLHQCFKRIDYTSVYQ